MITSSNQLALNKPDETLISYVDYGIMDWEMIEVSSIHLVLGEGEK